MGRGDPPGKALPAKAPEGHAFISYVREDSSRADRLESALERAGIPVWRDTAQLWPGEDWRAKIREAITGNALVFIACFSQASLDRRKSYQNEELNLAIEQLRRRQPDDPWLIPVRFDDCDIPDRDLGGGRTLASIQRVDLFGDHYEEELARLTAAILQILGRDSGAAQAEQVAGPPVIRDQPPRGGQRWLAPFAKLWRPAVLVPLAFAALALGAYGAFQLVSGRGSTQLTGSVICTSGRSVVGVWIAASTGQSDSGFAHLGPLDATGFSYPIGSAGTYSYRLPYGGTYAVHVGCGGEAGDWASSNYSPLLSAPTVHLRCDDPTTGTSRRGRCTVSAVP